MTSTEFLDRFPFKKSKLQGKDIFFNSSTQQASGLNTLQKYKRCRLSNISSSNPNFKEHHSNHFNVKTKEDISTIILEPKVDISMMLPPCSSHSALDISNTWLTLGLENTRNKQPYQPSSFGLDGAMKFTMADLNIITRNFSESLTMGQVEGFESVYLGHLQDGTTVVVKRINKVITNFKVGS